MNPCDNCVDPCYCNSINGCFERALQAEFGGIFTTEGAELNDELSDLKENVDIIAHVKKLYERENK